MPDQHPQADPTAAKVDSFRNAIAGLFDDWSMDVNMGDDVDRVQLAWSITVKMLNRPEGAKSVLSGLMIPARSCIPPWSVGPTDWFQMVRGSPRTANTNPSG
jgi:hypothetical protein